jgi:hypothetical protein
MNWQEFTALPGLLAFAFASNRSCATAGAMLRPWLAASQRLLWFNRGMACVLPLTAFWMLTL